MSEHTDEQILKRLAAWMGWAVWFGDDGTTWLESPEATIYKPLESLNDCQPLLEKMAGEDFDTRTWFLDELNMRDETYNQYVWTILLATPRQICTALVEAIKTGDNQ